MPLYSPIPSLITSGSVRALDVCNAILDATVFGAPPLTLPGEQGGLSESPVIVRQVLKRFYDFHRQWFAGQNVEDMTEYNDESGAGTRDAFDSSEPALGITYALLSPNFPYRDILKGTEGYKAIRQDDPYVAARIGWSIRAPNRGRYGNVPSLDLQSYHYRSLAGAYGLDGSNSLFGTLPAISTGELIGIQRKRATGAGMVPNVALEPLGNPDLRGNTEPGLKYQFDMEQGLGGGILGLPIYVMMNFGHQRGLKMNGTNKLPRKWAEHTMQTFWCASLPQLREVDAQPFVFPTSPTPFRRANSCVGCHGTIDRMSMVLRNSLMVGSDYTVITTGANAGSKLTYLAAQYNPEFISVNTWPHDPADPLLVGYHRQQAKGILYVRNLAGDMINQDFDGLDQLGTLLTSQDDFYQCTVKRYLEFMTGLTLPLYDVTDRRNAEAIRRQTKDEKELRTYVQALAQDLRTNQSLISMVKNLMASKYFRDRDYVLGTPE